MSIISLNGKAKTPNNSSSYRLNTENINNYTKNMPFRSNILTNNNMSVQNVHRESSCTTKPIIYYQVNQVAQMRAKVNQLKIYNQKLIEQNKHLQHVNQTNRKQYAINLNKAAEEISRLNNYLDNTIQTTKELQQENQLLKKSITQYQQNLSHRDFHCTFDRSNQAYKLLVSSSIKDNQQEKNSYVQQQKLKSLILDLEESNRKLNLQCDNYQQKLSLMAMQLRRINNYKSTSQENKLHELQQTMRNLQQFFVQQQDFISSNIINKLQNLQSQVHESKKKLWYLLEYLQTDSSN